MVVVKVESELCTHIVLTGQERLNIDLFDGKNVINTLSEASEGQEQVLIILYSCLLYVELEFLWNCKWKLEHKYDELIDDWRL